MNSFQKLIYFKGYKSLKIYLDYEDIWLSTSGHIRDLLEFSGNLITKAPRDLKISLILIDNAIELMLREFLRYNVKVSMGSVENMSYHQLLQKAHIQTIKDNDSKFMFIHDQRNMVYHIGSLVPVEKDVRSALSYAKRFLMNYILNMN
jgi:hypothetical protein